MNCFFFLPLLSLNMIFGKKEVQTQNFHLFEKQNNLAKIAKQNTPNNTYTTSHYQLSYNKLK